MKKKVLSLAMALVLCLGLTVPTFAAGPDTFDDGDITVTNVIEHAVVDKTFGSFYVYEALTCVAPVCITLNITDDDSYSLSVDRIPEGRELQDLAANEIEYLPVNGTKELTAGTYYVCVSFSPTDEHSGGFTGYLLTVQAGSETAPDVPVTGPTTTDPTDTIPASGTAYASTQTVNVDGKAVEFQMYALLDENGNGTNYIKLRDLAYVLNGTKAQFAVGYDGTISLTTGQPYAAAGGEMTTPFSGDRAYTGGTQTVKIDGGDAAMTAITLLDDNGGGYNYFKLRDLGRALGFNVSWSAEQGVSIETDKPYAE